MKVLIIEGSPHKNGTSNTLASKFADGARSAADLDKTDFPQKAYDLGRLL